VNALYDVTFEVGLRESVAIVGPSGSGKTTMLSIMGLLDDPTSGEVWISGVSAAQLSGARRSQLRSTSIGFVFQDFRLLPTLSAMENVELGMLYQGYRRRVRSEFAARALDVVGLSKRRNHLPAELSGGEQQRVAIARALAGGPAIILADEPTGALDQATGMNIVDLILDLASQNGTAIVLITHDLSVAASCSRRVSLLDGMVCDSR